MSTSEKQELEACLFGYPPYERYGAPEPEVFVELYPLLSEEMIKGVSIQLYTLEETTKNQRELLWNRFKSNVMEDLLPLIEGWKNVPQINSRSKYDEVDINRINLDELKTVYEYPVQVVEFLERKGHPTQLEA
jgi:polyphosphate kinase